MTRIICILLCAALLAGVISGCVISESNDSANMQESNPVGERPNEQPDEPPVTHNAQTEQKRFEAQILRTDGLWDCATQAIVLQSAAELQSYYEKYAEVLKEYGFLEKTSAYNDEFFTERTLIIVTKFEGSGSIRHEIKQVIQQADGNYVIHMDRKVPEIGSADCAVWHILVAIEGCSTEDAQVTVEVNNIYETSE